MLSSTFELPIRIKIKPPKLLAIGLLISHIGAILLLWFVDLVWWIKMLLAIATILSLIHSFHFYIWQKSPRSLIELILNDNEEWLLIRKDGKVVEACLRQGAFVHPMLIILPFRCGLQFTSVILTPDNVNADTIRRLRVRLRFKRKAT